ncbi:unnamed protein product, partial [Aphanomyces euteiches]
NSDWHNLTNLLCKVLKPMTMPIVIFHGDADVVTSPTVSKKFYEEIPSTNKSYVSLAGNYHNIFAEPEKDETIRSFVEWVKNPRRQLS